MYNNTIIPSIFALEWNGENECLGFSKLDCCFYIETIFLKFQGYLLLQKTNAHILLALCRSENAKLGGPAVSCTVLHRFIHIVLGALRFHSHCDGSAFCYWSYYRKKIAGLFLLKLIAFVSNIFILINITTFCACRKN